MTVRGKVANFRFTINSVFPSPSTSVALNVTISYSANGLFTDTVPLVTRDVYMDATVVHNILINPALDTPAKKLSAFQAALIAADPNLTAIGNSYAVAKELLAVVALPFSWNG